MLISVATAKIQIDSVSQVINYILINPIPFQFWFLQHLMLLSLASIIIIRVLNVKGEVTVGILTLCYIFSNTGSFGAWQESLLFYTLGCYLANNYQRISWKGLNKIFIPIYCGLIILCVWSQYVGISNTHYYIFKAIHRFSILIGTFAALAWVVSSKKAYKPLLSSGGRFMIYALHEPMQSFVKNIFVLYVSSQIGILLGYMFIPIVVILICIVLYRMVLTVNPKIASIITGGR